MQTNTFNAMKSAIVSFVQEHYPEAKSSILCIGIADTGEPTVIRIDHSAANQESEIIPDPPTSSGIQSPS